MKFEYRQSHKFNYQMYFTKVWNNPVTIIKFILANVLLSLLIILIFMTGTVHDFRSLLISFFWAFSINFTQWAGLIIVYAYLDLKISWIETPIKKTFVAILAFLGYSMSAFIL